MIDRRSPIEISASLATAGVVAAASIFIGGCEGKVNNQNGPQSDKSDSEKDLQALKVETAAPVNSVPIPKKMPVNIFATDIESINLSPETFTKDYAMAVQRATGIADVVIEAPLIVKIKVHPGDSQGSKIDLHKIWLKCKDSPGTRGKTMQPSIEAIFSMVNFVNKPLSGEEQSDKVVPLVRNRRFLEQLIAQHGGPRRALSSRFQENDTILYEAIPCDLFIVYSVHDPSGIRLLDRDYYTNHLAVKPDGLKSLAVQNLERLATSSIKLESEGPIFRVHTDDNYEPSLMLSDRVVATLQKRVLGKLVVSIPDNNVLLICGDEEPGALLKLKEETDRAYNRGKFKISDSLFIRDQGTWKIFTAFSTN